MGFSYLPIVDGEKRNLFGLAPGGVYQAIPITRDTGELLPRLFTLTHRGFCLGVRSFEFGVRSQPPNASLAIRNFPQSGMGGIFSVALSLPCGIELRRPHPLGVGQQIVPPLKNWPSLYSTGQSVLRTTLSCGARTFLPPRSRHRNINGERPSLLLRFPLSLYLFRFSSESPDWPSDQPPCSVPLGWIQS